MPNFQFSIPHQLGAEKAEDKLRNFFEMAKRGYGQGVSLEREEWKDNVVEFVLKASGAKLSGTITVEESAVQVTGGLPWTAFLFAGRIKKSFKEQLEKVLRSRKKPAKEADA